MHPPRLQPLTKGRGGEIQAVAVTAHRRSWGVNTPESAVVSRCSVRLTRAGRVEPHRRYVITKKVTDPAVTAAFAHLVADDEQLGYVPADLIPEV